MKMTYYATFEFTGNPSKVIQDLMIEEYVKCYNKYVDMCNDGLTERLNKEFFDAHPEKDDVWNDSEYNNFMAANYMKYSASKVKSHILRFYVDPVDVNLVGVHKFNSKITIQMFCVPKED